MDDEVELIYDDDRGLAVRGEGAAVEEFLRHYDLWEVSTKLDLTRLRPVLEVGGQTESRGVVGFEV